jgi:hypothetical protein
MWKRLGKALIATGAVISIGFNVIDAIELIELKLPISAWTAIGLCIGFIGIGALIHEQQKENATLKTQIQRLVDERSKGLRRAKGLKLQSSTITDEEYAKKEVQSRGWQGLSEAEFAQVYTSYTTMLVYHGHGDFDGFIDDQKRGETIKRLMLAMRTAEISEGIST